MTEHITESISENINADKILSINFKAQFSESDMHSRMRIGAIINIMIQSAVKASDKLGFGVKNASKNNLFWVLSRLELQIEKEIKWKDKITIETWPKQLDRFFYIRDFIIKDDKDNILARATSNWLVLNKTSKRPKILKGMDENYFADTKNVHAITEDAKKLEKIVSGEIFNVKTSYFDLDFNKHVSSSRYVDWLIDTFDIDFNKENYPRKLEINYLQESMSNENIRLLRHKCSDNEYIFEGKNMDNDKVCYRAKISF